MAGTAEGPKQPPPSGAGRETSRRIPIASVIYSLVLGTALVDYFVPSGVLASALYIVLITLSSRQRSPRFTVRLTALCGALTVGMFIVGHLGELTYRTTANHLLIIAAQVLTGYLVVRNLRWEEVNWTRAEREAALHHVVARIRSTLNLKAVLQATVDELLVLTNASRCCIYSFLGESEELVIAQEACAPGVTSVKGLRIPGARSPFMRQMRETKGIVAHTSVMSDPALAEFHDLFRTVQLQSILSCPVLLKDEIIGVIGLHQCDYERVWSEEELSLLQPICDQVALAIEHARLFEDIARGKKEWEVTFEAMADGVFIFEKDSTVKRANQAFMTMLGVGVEQVTGAKLRHLLYGVEEQPADCLFLTAMKAKRAVYRETDQLTCAGTFALSASPILDETGELSGGVGTIRNITQEKKLRDELTRSAQLAAVGQMTAQVAHEIKNPLTSLKLYSRYLESKLEADPGASEIARKITHTIDDLESTVAEITGLLRPVALRPEPTQVNELLREVISLVAEQGHSQQVTITQRLAPDLPVGNFDPRQLKKVFLNLLLNALGASTADGEIEVASSFATNRLMEDVVKELTARRGVLSAVPRYQGGERADFIHVRIIDQGQGMDRVTLGRIFEPFFTTKPTGIGLGLVTAKMIIDQHGGVMYIDSEPGVGTAAEVYLKIRRSLESH